jgi:hypothetical protein
MVVWTLDNGIHTLRIITYVAVVTILRNGIILVLVKYVCNNYRKQPDPIQTDMFMHTNVCTERGWNPRPLAQ